MFQGKDLKSYGLSCQPDVRVLPLTAAHRVLILGTDGLWDVLSADHAVAIACDALAASAFPTARQSVSPNPTKNNRRQRSPVSACGCAGENPAKALVEHALSVQSALHIQSDNITAMTVFFKH